jgi:hypothetical protein
MRKWCLLRHRHSVRRRPASSSTDRCLESPCRERLDCCQVMSRTWSSNSVCPSRSASSSSRRRLVVSDNAWNNPSRSICAVYIATSDHATSLLHDCLRYSGLRPRWVVMPGDAACISAPARCGTAKDPNCRYLPETIRADRRAASSRYKNLSPGRDTASGFRGNA